MMSNVDDTAKILKFLFKKPCLVGVSSFGNFVNLQSRVKHGILHSHISWPFARHRGIDSTNFCPEKIVLLNVFLCITSFVQTWNWN